MKKWSKLLIAVLLVVCVISPMFTTANCEINPIYDPSYVDSDGLAADMNEDWLLNLLSKFVFNVASWAENIIGNLFAMITGEPDFPWADRIVFNSITVLDVNFINPAENSYMHLAGEFIKDIYSTMFSIALALFGVLVLITAIKLAISTIASDKAKYKQALTSWVLGFVMLWTIHFLMAFLFYLNEQLVIEASKLAINSFDTANEALDSNLRDLYDSAYNVISNNKVHSPYTNEYLGLSRNKALWNAYGDAAQYIYIETYSQGTQDYGLYGWLARLDNGVRTQENLVPHRLTAILDYLDKNQAHWDDMIAAIDDSLEHSFYINHRGAWENFGNLANYLVFVKIPDSTELQTLIEQIVYGQPLGYSSKEKVYYDAVNNNVIVAGATANIRGSGKLDDIVGAHALTGMPKTSKVTEESFGWFFDQTITDKSEPANVNYYLGKVNKDYTYDGSMRQASLAVVLADIREMIELMKEQSKMEVKRVSYITTLAKYFKTNTHQVEVGSNATLVKTSPIISNQIMYAILVVQSIMLLLAYLKRLFFVLALAMMAPFVVVVDFFQKFGK